MQATAALSEKEAKALLKESAEGLMRQHKIPFEKAMKAILDGFRFALISSGDVKPADKETITTEVLIKAVMEGKFEELERKMNSGMADAKKKASAAKKGGSFQRTAPKNKFV
jgi:hypothetical protein